jgi:hypothetical protein
MPITKEMKAAWENCDFCSRSASDIAEIIRNPERWKKLPLGYKCAWKRISQVGFGRFGKSERWRELCYRRADVNNMPSSDWVPSDWMETWCAVYRAVRDMNNSPEE